MEKNTEVKFSGETKQIVLPEKMSYREAIIWLERRMEEDERVVEIYEEIEAYPLDAAHALLNAMSEKYGWTDLVPTPGFWGNKPPAMIGVQTSANEQTQVPWGRMQIPGIDGFIYPQLKLRKGRAIFAICGQVRRKHEKEIAEVARLTREHVVKYSIYRGKAIQLSFPDLTNTSESDLEPSEFNPKFLELTDVKPEELIFPDALKEQITTSLLTPIEKTEICRKLQIPLKRGVLMFGKYGTGKTLTAKVAAKKCEENGWTFLYLNSPDDLPRAIEFAQVYGPAMIFAEDIDEVMGTDDRDSRINGILNTIDGIDVKTSEIIVCLTTNHVDQINKAMMRPGRLDAVIHITPPDEVASQKLVRLYARGMVPKSENLDEVGVALDGQIPAVIREVVERSKLAAISRMTGKKGEKLEIHAKDLLTAARGMITHLKLMEPEKKDMRSDMEKAAAIVAGTLTDLSGRSLVSSIKETEAPKSLSATKAVGASQPTV